jgi:anaerobic selenocysteine-containing dehydrogenase
LKTASAPAFSVWGSLIHQMQSVDLPRQIHEETPYPIRCLYAHGLNYRIFPDPPYFLEALKKLDFCVDVDLFMTDSARWADVVLPACSSFEREEFKVYPGGFAAYYLPAVEPLYDSRSDARILQDLAKRMDLDDAHLKAGYRHCIGHVIKDTGLSIPEMTASPLPVKAPKLMKFVPYAYLDRGCDTPTGKLELRSEVVAACDPDKHLNPLPVWEEPAVRPTEAYPFILQTGVRIANAIHSRLHKVPWARSLRPFAAADISMEDACALGIAEGDDICLYNAYGSINVKANPTSMVRKGQIYMFHDYPEADVSTLLCHDHVDPYSGFPGFKSASCNLRKL